MVVKGRKRKTPSRVKYEQSRPTFSFRIYKDLDERIQEVKKAEGMSNTNIVEAGVGLFEVKVRKEKGVRAQAYDEGYDEGYKDAEELYKVTYPCKICRKTIEVMSMKEKEAIKGYMREHGWAHAACINRGY